MFSAQPAPGFRKIVESVVDDCALGRRGCRYFAPDGGCDGKVVGTEIFAYHPLGFGGPGIADSCNVGCAEAACAPCGAVVVDAGILGEKPVLYQFAALVCRLVLVLQWRMGVEVASG